MSSEILVNVEHVSKKFCRDLKQSLFYGLKDIRTEFLPWQSPQGELRPKEFYALKDVSFNLKRGECVGLIGKNGAGKSTILKLISGLIKPDQGRIAVRGRLGSLIELGAGFNPILTGRENIFINGTILGLTKKEINKKLDAIIEFAELEEFIDTPVQSYSSGMKVRLGFSIAAQMQPDILLIDEVFAVGDLGFVIKCLNVINRISQNAAVVIVSHNMTFIARACSHIIVLDNGIPIFNDQNVAEGINHYYTRFKAAECTVSGNGLAQIHKIKLESNGSQNVNTVNYGDDLSIHLHVTIDKSIPHPAIRIGFMSQEQEVFAQSISSFQGFEIENKGEPLHIVWRIPQVEFNPGVYSLTLGIADFQNSQILILMKGTTPFQVFGPFHEAAPIQLKGKWEVHYS